jgi:hypothetical protein
MYYLKGMKDFTGLGADYTNIGNVNPFEEPPRQAPKQNSKPQTAAQAVIASAPPAAAPVASSVAAELGRISNLTPSQKISEINNNLAQMGVPPMPLPAAALGAMDKIISAAKNADYLNNRNGITEFSTSENMNSPQFSDFKASNGFVNFVVGTSFNAYRSTQKTTTPFKSTLSVPPAVVGLLAKLGGAVAGGVVRNIFRNWDSFINGGQRFAAAQQFRDQILEVEESLNLMVVATRAASQGTGAYLKFTSAVPSEPSTKAGLAEQVSKVISFLDVPVKASLGAVQKLGEKLESAAVDLGVFGQYASAYKDGGLFQAAFTFVRPDVRQQVQAQFDKFKQTGKYAPTQMERERRKSKAKTAREERARRKREEREFAKSLAKTTKDFPKTQAKAELAFHKKRLETLMQMAQSNPKLVSQDDIFNETQVIADLERQLRPKNLPSLPSIATGEILPLGPPGYAGPSGYRGPAGSMPLPNSGQAPMGLPSGIFQRPEPAAPQAPSAPTSTYTPPVDPFRVFQGTPAMTPGYNSFWAGVINSPGWNTYSGPMPYPGIDTLDMPSSGGAFAGLEGLNMMSGIADDATALYYDLRSKGVDKLYADIMRSIAADLSARNWDSAYSKASTLIYSLYQQSPEEFLSKLRERVSSIPSVPGPQVTVPKGEYVYDYSGGKTVVSISEGPVQLPSGKVVTKTGPVIYDSRKPEDRFKPVPVRPRPSPVSSLVPILIGALGIAGLIYLSGGKKKK